MWGATLVRSFSSSPPTSDAVAPFTPGVGLNCHTLSALYAVNMDLVRFIKSHPLQSPLKLSFFFPLPLPSYIYSLNVLHRQTGTACNIYISNSAADVVLCLLLHLLPVGNTSKDVVVVFTTVCFSCFSNLENFQLRHDSFTEWNKRRRQIYSRRKQTEWGWEKASVIVNALFKVQQRSQEMYNYIRLLSFED